MPHTVETFRFLKLWQYPETGYAGADLSDWYPVVGRHRDSDALERTNFAAALARLRAIPGHDAARGKLRTRWYQLDAEGEEVTSVYVAGFSNPLVSWSETILLHKDSAPALLEEAESILRDLEAYPVLDDDALSSLDDEEAHTWWKEMGLRSRVELCQEAGVSIFAARRENEIPQDDTGYIYESLRRS
jgi:hypothetical protein